MKSKYLAWMCAPAFALALSACDTGEEVTEAPAQGAETVTGTATEGAQTITPQTQAETPTQTETQTAQPQAGMGSDQGTTPDQTGGTTTAQPGAEGQGTQGVIIQPSPGGGGQG